MSSDPNPLQEAIAKQFAQFAVSQRMLGTPREEIVRQLMEKGLSADQAEALLRGVESGMSPEMRAALDARAKAKQQAAESASPGATTAPTPDAQTTAAQPAGPPKPSPLLAIISLICGILAIILGFCCAPLALPAALGAGGCGIFALKKPKDQQAGRGMAIAGLICGGAGLVVGFIAFILFWVIPFLARASDG